MNPRRTWHFDKANWMQMAQQLSDQDWGELREGSVTEALEKINHAIQSCMDAHVPHSWKTHKKSSLPWVTTECRDAIRKKHDLEGSGQYQDAARKCAKVLRDARAAYFASLKTELDNLPKGSKRWWSLNRQLLNRQSHSVFFPPLRDSDGQWCKTPESKAAAFKQNWEAKFQLPPETHELFFARIPDIIAPWFPIRPRLVKRFLKALREHQATGPDGFSAQMLKKLADVLALPLAILIRRIFYEASWPDQWRLHHIMPLFKRGSAFLPGQYRGIHLSSILSKTVERVIGSQLVTFLESHGFGTSQWAFRKNSSARDLVTVYVASWTLLVCTGRMIGIYLSDIAGAFDRVSRNILMGKLSQLGLPDTFLDFINSYLLRREGKIRVEGALSDAMYLTDMVFQGTVLGPSLWNTFFADVVQAVPQGSQCINLFADDLTVMTSAPQRQSISSLQDELAEAQQRTHEWGRQNRVQFDPSKESFKILHPSRGQGDDFKLLGTLIDCRMTMQPCIDQTLSKIRPKIRAMLRLRHLYSNTSLINQFKTHIWCHIEYSSGAILLAPASQLQRLDKVQRWFLHEMGISDTTAFLDFNFAPPSLRRAIGMLGFLHKRALMKCHPLVANALPLLSDYGIIGAFHDKALFSHSDRIQYHRRLWSRSIFHFIHIYNRLPQALVDIPSVSAFQRRLTQAAKRVASADSERWRQSFQDLVELDRWLHS